MDGKPRTIKKKVTHHSTNTGPVSAQDTPVAESPAVSRTDVWARLTLPNGVDSRTV